MRLSERELQNREKWESRGYRLPAFDRAAAAEKTKAEPRWIHFGGGNTFRALQAHAVQKMLDCGAADTGLIVAGGPEIVEKISRPCDNYSVLVTLRADGSTEKTVIGSVVETLVLDAGRDDFRRLREIFRNPSLQMASFTITEKGYSIRNSRGEFLPEVSLDMERGPEKPQSYIGKVVSLLHERWVGGGYPVAAVSMDNCARNGDRLREVVLAFADAWETGGLAEPGFSAYIGDPEKVSFPWTMIDKITPRPSESVRKMLEADGLEDIGPVITARRSCVAPYVNSEECEYLIIEDAFPNGRPALEAGGLILTDRETVEKAERMKVCTCLNPLHTALAIYGCLLGYTRISEEMKDPLLVKLAEGIGYGEGLPAAEDPGILDPREFLDAVIRVRLPNPAVPDTPQRIAMDTSQKLPIRFGETIKAYEKLPGHSASELRFIPLVLAGWLRYLTGIDDGGERFELSPDPMIPELRPLIGTLRFGDAAAPAGALKPLLADSRIFGVDLYEAGLAEKVCGYLTEMMAGPGAVRAVLEKYL